MTDHKGQAVSPYLMKPLRSLQQALEEQQQLAAQQEATRSEPKTARERYHVAGAAKAVTRALSQVA
ncbi:MAG: hypothetical protein ACFCUQ_08455 [Kiloniellales bacterium]